MNVLIVDDSPVNRKLLRFTFEIEGFTVVEAADGVEAIACLRAQKSDCIVSDILMPNMDGYMLAFTLRRDPRLFDVPTILYSSTYDSPADEKLALKAGAHKFIKKPAPPQEIVDAVRGLVQQKKNAAALSESPAIMSDLDVMREYSAVLIEKLETRNEELIAKTAELQRTNDDLQRFNKNAVGRELRMVELKKQVNELSKELGRKPPYDLSFGEGKAA